MKWCKIHGNCLKIKKEIACSNIISSTKQVLLLKFSQKRNSRILWSPKFHCRTHKSPSPVPILSLINPVPPSLFYFLKIHFNIIIRHSPRSSNLSLSLMLLHQHPIRTTSLFVTCHIPRPSHSSWFDHLKSIWWVQSTKLLIVVLNLWFLRPWGLTRWYMLSVGWLPTFRRNFVQHSDPIYTCLHERRRFWILNPINQDVICNHGMNWRE